MQLLSFFELLKFSRKSRKWLFQIVLAIFFALNVLAYLGAYAFTHFRSPHHLGLGLPRPTSPRIPSDIGLAFVTERIPINQDEWLETWLIAAQSSRSRGTVLLFPGHGGSKATQLLAPSEVFHHLGYDTLLVDFRGVGGSSGNTTTLGVREAKDVALVLDYAQHSSFQRPLVLYGVSMGSAAILRAIAHERVNPDAVILELPFATLLDAVRSRLRAIRIPTFPLAEVVVFWLSIQHQFNGYVHNPVTYAKQVQSPTLVLHGELDRWITVEEINQIVQNLNGNKELIIFPDTGHSLLVTVDRELWRQSVDQFLKKV